MVCATYRKKGKDICSSHQIRNSVLKEQILAGIRSITSYAREHEDEFVQMVTKKSQDELNKSLRDSKRELEQHTLEIRVTELKALIATEKESSTNVDGFKIQRIRIVWNCIGEVVLPHKEKSA